MFKIESNSYIGNTLVHNTIMDALRADLMYSFAGDSTKPALINKIVLVDDANNEKDYTTINPSDWVFTSVEGGKRATVTKIITATTAYNIAKIRLYGGTSLYFEGTLSSPYAVNANDKVKVVTNIDAMLGLVHHSGGTLIEITPSLIGPDEALRRFTTGERRGKKITTIGLVSGGAVIRYITGDVSHNPTTNEVYLNASFQPDSNITINGYDYLTEDNYTIILVKIQEMTLTPDTMVSFRLAIAF